MCDSEERGKEIARGKKKVKKTERAKKEGERGPQRLVSYFCIFADENTIRFVSQKFRKNSVTRVMMTIPGLSLSLSLYSQEQTTFLLGASNIPFFIFRSRSKDPFFAAVRRV